MLAQSLHETENVPCSRSGLELLSSELSSLICSASSSLTVVLSLLSRLCTRRLCTRSRFHTAVPTSCTYLSISCNVNASTFHHPPQSDWLYVSFGQGSSLLWTHTLRPLYSRPIVLTQEGRSLVNDVCECVRD